MDRFKMCGTYHISITHCGFSFTQCSAEYAFEEEYFRPTDILRQLLATKLLERKTLMRRKLERMPFQDY